MKNERQDISKDRLLAHREIDLETGCWWWTLHRSPEGYGQTTWSGRKVPVHRVAAVLWMDFDYESDKLVLHHCDNRACFNPDHLYVGDQADNIRDAMQRGRHWVLRGDAHPGRKLNDAQVAAIRAEYEPYKMGYTKLGKKYGVHRMSIKGIISGGKRQGEK